MIQQIQTALGSTVGGSFEYYVRYQKDKLNTCFVSEVVLLPPDLAISRIIGELVGGSFPWVISYAVLPVFPHKDEDVRDDTHLLSICIYVDRSSGKHKILWEFGQEGEDGTPLTLGKCFAIDARHKSHWVCPAEAVSPVTMGETMVALFITIEVPPKRLNAVARHMKQQMSA